MKPDFKFCPTCGGKFLLNKEGQSEYYQCQKCGFLYFINSIPATAAVITNKKGELLLVQRAMEPGYGKWSLVGGFLNNGEKPEEAIKREVKEEAGIEIKVEKYLGNYISKYSFNKKLKNYYILAIVYQCSYISGKTRIDDESLNARWFNPKDIPWTKFAFPSHKKLLKDFIK